jgi:alkylated DNA nucleotide flippase Atl1
MSRPAEIIVDLANSVPPGEWVTYGTIGEVKKRITGTGNGRGTAQCLQAHRSEVGTWHRIRDRDGYLVASTKNDPRIAENTKGHWSEAGGFVVTDPAHQANRDFVAEGGRVDSNGAAVGGPWDIDSYVEVATVVVERGGQPRSPTSSLDDMIAKRRAAFEERFLTDR